MFWNKWNEQSSILFTLLTNWFLIFSLNFLFYGHIFTSDQTKQNNNTNALLF